MEIGFIQMNPVQGNAELNLKIIESHLQHNEMDIVVVPEFFQLRVSVHGKI